MNLAGKTWGGTDQAYKTVLTKPAATSTIGSGYQIHDGEGTSLPLYFSSDGVGFVNGGGFRSSVTTSATSNRTITFSDASGRVSAELVSVLAADATNSTTTPSAVSSFGVTLEVSAIYEFEIILRCQTAAATTGLQFQVTGPTSQIDWAVYEAEFMTAATLSASITSRQSLTALATTIAATGGTAASIDYITRVKGLLKTTATTPASDIGISFMSETAATAVTVKSGSIIRFRKIN